jgi:hypothetical protein
MKYWTGLHSDVEATQLQQGAGAFLNLALGAGNDASGSSSAPMDGRRLLNQADEGAVEDARKDEDNMEA